MKLKIIIDLVHVQTGDLCFTLHCCSAFQLHFECQAQKVMMNQKLPLHLLAMDDPDLHPLLRSPPLNLKMGIQEERYYIFMDKFNTRRKLYLESPISYGLRIPFGDVLHFSRYI